MQRLAAFALLLLAWPAFGQITGTVYTAQGKPLAGATVRAYRAEAEAALLERIVGGGERKALAEATTGEHGDFSLDTKVAGVVEVVIEADGYLPSRSLEVSDEKDLSIALAPAVMKRGRVTAGGKPVAGALVIVSYNNGHRVVVRSAEDGAYSIRYGQPVVSGIDIVHPAFARHSIEMQRIGGPPLQLDVSLDPGRRIAGRVLHAGGAPAAKTRLVVNQWPAGITNDDGTFVIAHAPAKAAVYAVSDNELGTAPAGEAMEIRLSPAAAVSGTIRDGKGRPIPGLLVLASGGTDIGADRPPLNGGSVSDAKGNYRIGGLAPLAYDLQPGAVEVLQFASATVDLRRKLSATRDFTATTTRFLRVTVVDHQQQPVGGAHIIVGSDGPLYYSNGDPGASVVTGANGRGRVAIPEGMDRGGAPKIRLTATHPGYPIASKRVEWREGGPAPVVLTLPEGIEVKGMVVDADGKPVSGVAIGIIQDPPAGVVPVEVAVMYGELASWVTTGADGRFSVRLNRAIHDLGLSKEGYAASRAADVDVQANMAPLRVTLDRGVEIRGRVVRKGATSLSGTIAAHSEETSSVAITSIGADGAFALTGLRPGSYIVQLDEDQTPRTIRAPAADVVIELQGQGEIRGRATDKATGMPVTAFLVRATPRAGDDTFGDNFTADDGTFTLHAPEGHYDIAVTAEGYLTTTITDVAVEIGKSSSEVMAALSKGRKLVGRITGADGAPLAEASVEPELKPGQSDGAMETQASDEDGSYEVPGLPPSELTVSFSHPGYLTGRKTVAAGNADVKLDVVLSSGRKVSGRVVNEDGAPVADADVTAVPAAHAAASQSAHSGADGTFTVEGLGVGRHSFAAGKSGYESAELKDVDLDAGKPIVLTLHARLTATIHGRVAGFSRQSWISGAVHASGNKNGVASGQIARDGSYRIENAPAGEVEVRAQTVGIDSQSSSKPVSVTVAANSDVEVNLSFDDDTTIRGAVTRNGVPVPGAMILFRKGEWTASWRTTARADGSYELKGLEPGHYGVDVDLRDNTTYSLLYDVTGSATFDINASFVHVEGRVIDDGGTAVDGAVVVGEPSADPKQNGANRQSLTTGQGTFGFDLQTDGLYRLTASKQGFASAVTEVDTHRAVTPVELELQRGGSMRLRLVDARDGTTLTGYVVVRNAAGQQVAHPEGQEPDGTFELRLPEGSYRISVSAENYASQTVRATLPAGEQRIALTPGGTLVVNTDRDSRDPVRLVLPDGEEYVSCYCNGIADFHLTSKRTTLEHIAPGSYQLRLFDDHGKLLSTANAVVREGATSEVEVK